ncbi:MAG: 3-oxoacyl-[acyl-carrier-protein] reductase [Dehalococcoidia bacterium]|nr:3-oxoacyl-[acyl-carrier-protein] reductase [Dehalococcoidia bacterium]
MTLEGKIALVTGGGRGIGRAIALQLASEGASIILNSLTSQNAETASQEIRSIGGQAQAFPADVSSPTAVKTLFEAIRKEYQRIDILVNNAGIIRDHILLKMQDNDWNEILQNNLNSIFLCSRAALRMMLPQRWGRIISISSIAAFAGNTGQTSYAAAKAGIIGFTRSLARETARNNITVNAIAPGLIETDMTNSFSAKQKSELVSRIPLGYAGTPQDVAEAVSFLSSDRARYITGQTLTIDGGLTIC